jgi:hypothetical protein
MTKLILIEFNGEIVEAGDSGVKVVRDDSLGRGKIRIPSQPDEEQTCGKHLYSRVRVTLELIDEEPTP